MPPDSTLCTFIKSFQTINTRNLDKMKGKLTNTSTFKGKKITSSLSRTLQQIHATSIHQNGHLKRKQIMK